ncbi:hypothetical protein [Amycolatopsis cihanbeyliensis]|nr:hypothetical protein [Amycolatopsis cihanbeyliensis]
MRRKGYWAAAALGVVAPLALAAPGSAMASPADTTAAHTGEHDIPIVSDLLGGLDLLGGSDHDDFDRDPADFDERDGDVSEFDEGYVTVYASDADRGGNVSFIVEGRDLPSLMEVTLSSAGLDAACVGGNSLDGQTVQADLSGDFNVGATGTTCIDGTYRADVTEQSTPYETFSADVTIES